MPDNLDLSFLPHGRQDAARYLVGRLYLARHDAGKEPDDYQSLYAPLLQTLLGADYRRGVIDPLLDHGVIEEDSSYSTGWEGRKGYSKSFRLTAEYRHERFRPVVLAHPEVVRRLTRHRTERQAALDNPAHNHLRHWLGRLTVVPDYPPDVLPLRTLADGERWFEPCQQGRVHTPLTNLARPYRRYLAVEGVDEPMVSIDVKTCQPLLLALALRDRDRLTQDEGFIQYAHERATHHQDRRGGNQEEDFIPYVGGCSSECSGDLGRFIDVCLSGDLYSLFVAETGYARDQVKKFFLATVYGRPHEAGRTKTGRAFRRLFPGVWEAVAEVNAGGHGRLPQLMQTVESWLVIWRTCGRLAAALPDAPLLTLHDCLVTTERYVEPVRRALVGEFDRVWGVQPQTDTKPLAA